jgi:hypothetical protein
MRVQLQSGSFWVHLSDQKLVVQQRTHPSMRGIRVGTLAHDEAAVLRQEHRQLRSFSNWSATAAGHVNTILSSGIVQHGASTMAQCTEVACNRVVEEQQSIAWWECGDLRSNVAATNYC